MSHTQGLLVIKIGTHVITGEAGLLDEGVIASIAAQLAQLQASGYKTVLVSSGAVAAGRSMYQGKPIKAPIERRQVLSSIGQIELLSVYRKRLEQQGLQCAQVLVTKEDFKSRSHYLNMKNCIEALLQNDIVPIVNENDVVSITELMFTDNDELAGLVSAMLNASQLILLTSVDGIFDRDPGDPDASLISVFDPRDFDKEQLQAGKQSEFGRGGILTKSETALKVSGMGIPVLVANGRTENILVDAVSQPNPTGTLFPPGKSASTIKKYIAHAYDAKGRVVINKGAAEALQSNVATSLLPIGIIKVIGDFEKGDVIHIEAESGKEIGLGLARTDATKVRALIGKKGEKPVIHYDHLYLH